MSFPPPPGGPPPGNPGPPQGYSGPYGPPPQQPPWPQQWQAGPPPKKRGNGWKWVLGGVALLAVIGVTAAVTISVTSESADDGDAPSGETYGLASADDKGPVNIITEDPTCAAWTPIIDTFADIQRKGWNRRDASVPRDRWTSEERTHFEEVGRAADRAADQAVALVRLTPNRVMRELYGQFIAYARAYSDAIAQYQPSDENLARVMTNASAALVFACDAIDFKSAEARLPLAGTSATPTELAPLTDPNDPTRFMAQADQVCADWNDLVSRLDTDTRAWQELDSAVPASRWSPDQRAIIDGVIPRFQEFANRAEQLALQSSNPVLQDFAIFSAQYRRAYAAALPTYTAADSFLASAGGAAASTIQSACKAARG